MLRTFTVTESTLVLLKRLQQVPILSDLRLVGGTALALQLGHRNSVDLASLQDIAAMKLHAITGRGKKKDFIDLYFLLQHFSLEQIIEFYQKKYPQNSLFFVIKSLSYFNDAEMDPMPTMFIDVSWEEMKSTIRSAIENF